MGAQPFNGTIDFKYHKGNDTLNNVYIVKDQVIKLVQYGKKSGTVEGSFVFDETGIKLMAMDSTHSILIHMKLDSENFEFFHCPKKVIIGVNMLNFFKLIKTMGNNETLTLFIEENNTNKYQSGCTDFKIDPARRVRTCRGRVPISVPTSPA